MTARLPARLVVVLAVLLGACVSDPPAPPNFVLIYADDLGWRDLGVQGSDYYETPHLDQLAADGIRFTNAYANAPNCAPSRAALLSGQYAPRTGIYTVASAARGPDSRRALIPVENRTDLPPEVVTLAETLGSVGYATGHVGKWHLGGDGSLPTDHGFSFSIAGDAGGSPTGYFYPYVRGDRVLPGLEHGEEGENLTDRLVHEATGFIEREADGPFFLFLSHYGVHTPIQGKPEVAARYREKPASDGHESPEYAAMIETLDDGVGRILATLDRLGLDERTVVVFASDNGGYGPITSMAPLRGSKGMLYEGGIRVPMIWRWPDKFPAGVTSATPVIGTDVYPTFAELAGIPLPTSQPVDGANLTPVLFGAPDLESEVTDRELVWHFPAYLEADRSVAGAWRTTPSSAIRQGQYKLLHFFEEERWEVYDLDADLSETTDISDLEPEVTNRLRGALIRWWERTDAFVPSEPNPDFEPASEGRW